MRADEKLAKRLRGLEKTGAALGDELKRQGIRSADEKLAALRERYPGRVIAVTERMVNRDMWEQEGFVATAHTVIETLREGAHINGMGDLGIEAIRPTEAEALDALAEALERLGVEVVVEYHSGSSVGVNAAEGVTIPRKIALALALFAAGRWAGAYTVRRLGGCSGIIPDDWARQVFAALGTTADDASAEMQEAQ